MEIHKLLSKERTPVASWHWHETKVQRWSELNWNQVLLQICSVQRWLQFDSLGPSEYSVCTDVGYEPATYDRDCSMFYGYASE